MLARRSAAIALLAAIPLAGLAVARDDFVAFLEAFAADFGEAAIGQARHDRDLRGLSAAHDMDALDEAASLIGSVCNPEHRTELAGIYDECARALGGE